MLIDDEERLVELFIDNIIWGNIAINWNILPDESKKPATERIGFTLGRYVTLRQTKIIDAEYKNLISELATFFIAHRFVGDITGEIHDRDLEIKLKELESHNNKFAEYLSQAYVTPKDEKVGTT